MLQGILEADALAEYLLACDFADRLLHVERDACIHARERLLSRSRWWRCLICDGCSQLTR